MQFQRFISLLRLLMTVLLRQNAQGSLKQPPAKWPKAATSRQAFHNALALQILHLMRHSLKMKKYGGFLALGTTVVQASIRSRQQRSRENLPNRRSTGLDALQV